MPSIASTDVSSSRRDPAWDTQTDERHELGASKTSKCANVRSHQNVLDEHSGGKEGFNQSEDDRRSRHGSSSRFPWGTLSASATGAWRCHLHQYTVAGMAGLTRRVLATSEKLGKPRTPPNSTFPPRKQFLKLSTAAFVAAPSLQTGQTG